MHDAVWLNVNLATMAGGAPYGTVSDGALAVADGRISWVGPRRDWREKARIEHDARGAWITPGLVDCHTHLVYAGDRAAEFELRLKGASYEEIARALRRAGQSAGTVLRGYVGELGLPTQLRNAGIKKEILPAIAASWDGAPPIATNPRKVAGKEDLLEILELAW